MKIALVAPLVEAVPPSYYGGTERVVSVLTEELVRRGHDVTLFASGDSYTSARLVPCSDRGLRLGSDVRDYPAHTIEALREVYARAAGFDLIHNHVDYLAFPFARLSDTPTITTVHGRLDLPETLRMYAMFREQRLVSISRSQRAQLPGANWVATVYNGIDLDNFTFNPRGGDYLAFVGRVSPEKRVDRAIAVAQRVGMRLIIAAKVDPAETQYYADAIKPLIQGSRLVEFVGEVDERGKDQLLGGAYASLLPVDWPEPFGLTMVESMATGTPVIAYRAGSVPEIVKEGVTGYVCDSMQAMVDAVPMVADLDRRACRQDVEERFSSEVMTSRYEEVYSAILGQR
jgi:glycosyltransferase involved in cell wall biosynthesis